MRDPDGCDVVREVIRRCEALTTVVLERPGFMMAKRPMRSAIATYELP